MPTNGKQLGKYFIDRMRILSTEDSRLTTFLNKVEEFIAKEYKIVGKRYSKLSPFGIVMTVLEDIKNLLFAQQANAIDELNVHTASKADNIRGIAANNGYHALRAIPATGLLACKVSSNIAETGNTVFYINNGAILKDPNSNLKFEVILDGDRMVVNSLRSSKFYLSIVQGETKTLRKFGSGERRQVIELIETGATIAEHSIFVKVNGFIWDKYELLSSMGSGTRGWLERNGYIGKTLLNFGNGNNGLIPTTEDTIEIEYKICNGEAGNLYKGTKLEFESGVIDRDGNEINITDYVTLEVDSNMIDGYNGDDVDDIRLNIGSQSRSNIVSTEGNLITYLKRYPQFVCAKTWVDVGVSIINALVIPNLPRITDDYFSLDTASFKVSDKDRENLLSAIYTDKKYALLSDVRFVDYQVVEFGIIAMVKTFTTQIPTQLNNDIVGILNQAIMDEFVENPQKISRSVLINRVMGELSILESFEIKFVANPENGNFIDAIGDIDTTKVDDAIYMPIITSSTYDNVEFNNPVKVMVQNSNGNTWLEI